MDKMVKNQIIILNLTGGLSEELSNYFASKKVLIVDPEVDSSSHEWTHILTKDMNDFSQVSEFHQTIEKDIRIISLTPVEDLQHFVVSNGKLILDELWMRNSLGAFILDKFLQEFGGITLGDNYPTFKEKGSFVITNPFNTGEYLDRMVQSAYLDGISGLSIKTFFDHLVMYLTGLKTKGKMGMPIEVTYGYFEDVFGVQLHFFTKDLILEDVTSSLSSTISKQAEKYLLNIAVQSSDFFDFTLLREVNKTVITGLWTKDERIKAENRGLLFNDLSAAASITSYPTEGITSFQVNDPALNDFSDKVVLPPSPKEEEHKQTISGGKEEAPFVQTISGSETEDEIINLIKGKIEEEEQVFRIAGNNSFDVEKFAYRVSSGIESKTKGDDVLKIKSLKSDLPEAIKNSFQEFASKLNKSINDISESDLETFKEVEIPKIIKDTTKKIDTKFNIFAGNDKNSTEAPKDTEKLLELKITGINAENENLKSKIKTLMTEVKILKDSKAKMAEIHSKAVQASAEAQPSLAQQSAAKLDNAFKEQILEKMNSQKTLTEQDTKKLAALMEKEAKFLQESRDHEVQLKKLQIETTQKETFVAQEMEKLTRLAKSKDLMITKAKEGFSKILEQKDLEIKSVNDKLAVASKAMASNQSQNQAQKIRDLEKQVINHEKMIEIYKNKMVQKPVVKGEDDLLRDDNKRMQLLTNQMKNQLEMAKKETMKYQERMASDAAVINTLKVDKSKLEQQLKKDAQDTKREAVSNLNVQQQDQELKKLKAQYEFLEKQFNEGQLRRKEIEAKLQEALKGQKKDAIIEEPSTKGKAAHLEANVRKLTQDLVETRNQMAEMKKETNKLRLDKTSLQNQIDKMKKDAEKAKAAAPKTPGTPGKAA
jgi:regulator of replication initiation timing